MKPEALTPAELHAFLGSPEGLAALASLVAQAIDHIDEYSFTLTEDEATIALSLDVGVPRDLLKKSGAV